VHATDGQLQFTALHRAAVGGHTEAARELLGAGASEHVAHAGGRTAVDLAAEFSQHSVAELLESVSFGKMWPMLSERLWELLSGPDEVVGARGSVFRRRSGAEAERLWMGCRRGEAR
jgi:ankyrin repeat protein